MHDNCECVSGSLISAVSGVDSTAVTERFVHTHGVTTALYVSMKMRCIVSLEKDFLVSVYQEIMSAR